MLNKKESDNATRASIKKEMAKPSMAKSVRTSELNLDAERVPGQGHPAWNRQQDHRDSAFGPTGKGTDCYGGGGRPVSRSPY